MSEATAKQPLAFDLHHLATIGLRLDLYYNGWLLRQFAFVDEKAGT
jgi:hypothetical protein